MHRMDKDQLLKALCEFVTINSRQYSLDTANMMVEAVLSQELYTECMLARGEFDANPA